MKNYRAGLPEGKQQDLKALMSSGRAAAYKQIRTRNLLLSGEDQDGGPMRDQDIDQAPKIGTATVERVRRCFVEQGVEAALGRKEQLNRRRRKLDGEGEAHQTGQNQEPLPLVLRLCCSRPPAGTGS